MDTTYTVLVVGAGVTANLAIATMFVLRVVRPDRARSIGLLGTAMGIPLAMAAGHAWVVGADGWTVALPAAFVVFAVVEIAVDVVWDFDIRTSRWLVGYLALFYVGQWGVIGAAFRADPGGGAAVLVTYFVCLAATAYSYRRVGHGTPRTAQPGGDREITSPETPASASRRTP